MSTRPREQGPDLPTSYREPLRVGIASEARLPTRFGTFTAIGFWNNRDAGDHFALVQGDVRGAEGVLTRIHSECVTGDALGSLRCDCRDQLEHALRRVDEVGRGIVLYMRQEGRGIGLFNKLRAYELQDQGLDTVDANRALGLPDDARDYAIAAAMIRALGPTSIELMSNNPDKVAQLQAGGIVVARRVPHLLPSNPHNVRYLQTKAVRAGHLIPLEPPLAPELSGLQAPKLTVPEHQVPGVAVPGLTTPTPDDAGRR